MPPRFRCPLRDRNREILVPSDAQKASHPLEDDRKRQLSGITFDPPCERSPLRLLVRVLQQLLAKYRWKHGRQLGVPSLECSLYGAEHSGSGEIACSRKDVDIKEVLHATGDHPD